MVDEAFAGLSVPAMSLRDAIEKVVLRSEHGDRRIVSWSQHDLEVVRTLRDVDPGLIARFESRYASALGVAKHWRNKVHGSAKPPSGRLADYLALIGYPVPDDAAPGQVARPSAPCATGSSMGSRHPPRSRPAGSAASSTIAMTRLRSASAAFVIT